MKRYFLDISGVNVASKNFRRYLSENRLPKKPDYRCQENRSRYQLSSMEIPWSVD